MEFFNQLGIEASNPGATTGELWCSALSGPAIESLNPATNEPLASVFLPTAEDLEKVIKAAEMSFNTWRQIPAPKRGEVIRAIADELRASKDALGTLVSLETGKIKQEGDGEVQEMIDIADYAVGLSRMLYGHTMPSERSKHRMFEQWHPLGPIAVITAFNFPVAVWAWNAFIAAVCGDTIIWKPSPKAPLCAIAVQTLCERVLEKFGYYGVFSLFISNDVALTHALVDDKRIPLVSFTGSTAVGKHIAERVARRLGKYLLELSGNNAVIVDEFADLKKAVPSIVFGAVGTAGQRCTSTRRVFVHHSRTQELTKKLISAYQQVNIGDPLTKNVLLGPLIDRQAVETYLSTLHEIQALGGEVLYGGHEIAQPGNFVQPTIVNANPEWPIVHRETFAPILYLMEYDILEKAITWHNAVSQGLSSAIFTDNLLHAELFLSSQGSDCGIANVNIGTSGAEIGGAFGGEKDTGGGREAGSDAWKNYMRRQTNTINWGSEMPLAQGIRFDIGE